MEVKRQGATYLIERPILNVQGAAADLTGAAAYIEQTSQDGTMEQIACTIASESNVVSGQLDTSKLGQFTWAMRIWLNADVVDVDKDTFIVIPAQIIEKPV